MTAMRNHRSRSSHKNGLRIKQPHRRLGQTAGRQRRRHRHAGPLAASRTRAQVRPAQLVDKRLRSGGRQMIRAKARSKSGKSSPAASRLGIQKPRRRSLTIGISPERRNPLPGEPNSPTAENLDHRFLRSQPRAIGPGSRSGKA